MGEEGTDRDKRIIDSAIEIGMERLHMNLKKMSVVIGLLVFISVSMGMGCHRLWEILSGSYEGQDMVLTSQSTEKGLAIDDVAISDVTLNVESQVDTNGWSIRFMANLDIGNDGTSIPISWTGSLVRSGNSLTLTLYDGSAVEPVLTFSLTMSSSFSWTGSASFSYAGLTYTGQTSFQLHQD